MTETTVTTRTTATATIFALLDEVLAPLVSAVPERPSPMEFLDPDFRLPAALQERPPPDKGDLAAEAEQYTKVVGDMAAMGLLPEGEVTPAAVALYRTLRAGHIRGVVTGVFADRAEPLQVRFFGDQDCATVLNVVGGEVLLRSGSVRGLPQWAFDDIRDVPRGPGGFVELRADEHGLLPGRAADTVAMIRRSVARPRYGTVLVDLSVRDRIRSEYPRGAFVLFDNDVGRYFLGTSVNERGHWVLQYAPAGRAHAERWVEHAALG
ncbi:ESX secretion-associated protein EspG [Amycolatopsis aidingensis]|uniref:ESX secretion-associated protein EspG n=1 Tax=Amycolatopsis aidingensis TaxID=2842453 RepID=UPI001E4700CD|nr:ESX secretion-associated protein EspG [Amycolatopsis aidingensis]